MLHCTVYSNTSLVGNTLRAYFTEFQIGQGHSHSSLLCSVNLSTWNEEWSLRCQLATPFFHFYHSTNFSADSEKQKSLQRCPDSWDLASFLLPPTLNLFPASLSAFPPCFCLSTPRIKKACLCLSCFIILPSKGYYLILYFLNFFLFPSLENDCFHLHFMVSIHQFNSYLMLI